MKKTTSILFIGIIALNFSCTQPDDGWLISDFLNNTPENAVILGNPEIVDSPFGDAVFFDGVDDGILLDYTPLYMLQDFTIEVIMRPDKGGAAEQRFLHMGEMNGQRVMMETRLKGDDWYLDAYFHSGDIKLQIIDSTRLYPLGEWYNFTVCNQNGDVEVFINGKSEFKESIPFTLLPEGATSIGVRQNEIHWYTGAFYKIRITPEVLKPEKFLSVE